MAQGTVGNEPCAAAGAAIPTGRHRIAALDALRGFDMFWIVGGRELALAVLGLFAASPPAWLDDQLEHAAWEGFTAWDLIMPLFLFVVGAAMPFSFSRRLEQGDSQRSLYAKIFRRSAILFVLGMIVQGHLLDFNLSTLHLFSNTLQAIAVGYLLAGLVMLNVGMMAQAVFAALLLVGYWLLLVYVPVPGQGVGVLKPDANLALVVDEFVLGRFRDGTPYTWVLSGMTFTATVLLGVFAGHVLRSRLSPWQRLLVLTALGLACLAAVSADRHSRLAALGLPVRRDRHERHHDLRRQLLHPLPIDRQEPGRRPVAALWLGRSARRRIHFGTAGVALAVSRQKLFLRI